MNKITVLKPDKKRWFNSAEFDTFSGDTVVITEEEIETVVENKMMLFNSTDMGYYKGFKACWEYIKSRINQ